MNYQKYNPTKTKKDLLLLCVIFLLSAELCACGNSESHPQNDKRLENHSFSKENTTDSAYIYYETDHYNIDTIDTQKGGKIVFHYTNEGKTPLIITNVLTSCGCIEKIWNPEPLPFGQSDSIVIRIRTHELGQIQKAVVVKNNSINNPIATIRFEGYVIKGDN